jgi:hypothetical protein
LGRTAWKQNRRYPLQAAQNLQISSLTNLCTGPHRDSLASASERATNHLALEKQIMTETVNENTTTENKMSVREAAWKNSPFAAVFEGSLEALTDIATKVNELVARVKAEGNEQDQLNEILLHSDDKNVVEYRKLKEELENDLANNLETITNYAKDPKNGLMVKGDFDVESATKQIQDYTDKYKKLTAGLRPFDGGEDFVNSLPKINSLKGSGNSTGQQRWRMANLEVKPATSDDSNYERVFESKPILDSNKKPTGQFEDVQTFTVLSKVLKEKTGQKVDVANIYQHATEVRNETEPFTFALSIPKADGNSSDNFMVRVTPKV